MSLGTIRQNLPAFRQPGWDIPWLLVAGFGFVLAVNAALIRIAMSTWTGISTDHAYDKGIIYNRNLEAPERQAALGWRASLEMAQDAGLGGTLAVRPLDAPGQPLERADVRADFERPTQQGHDFGLTLERTASGTYAAPVEAPLAGVRDVRVAATRAHDRLVTTERAMLR